MKKKPQPRRWKIHEVQIHLRLTQEQADKVDRLAGGWCSRQEYIRTLIDKAGKS